MPEIAIAGRAGTVTPTTIDCHCHIIDPARFAFAPAGGYRLRPDETGTRESFLAELDRCGVASALLVQPSCYGTDNRPALDAVAWQSSRFKLIAVVPPDISAGELAALKAQGVVGVRFNLQFDPGALVVAEKMSLLARLEEQGYFVQVHGRDEDWAGAVSILRKSGLKVIIDHLGLERADEGMNQEGFQAMLGLGQDGDAVIKLSGFFRSSRRGPPYEDIDPFADAIVKNFGVARCVWGSDWPFLGVSPRPSYEATLAPLARWLSAPSDLKHVLWDNPRRLFGFAEESP
jgi:predicted TIM-barrel fold metal-dependent hydrolase